MNPEKFGRRELTGDELEKGNLPGTDTYDDGLNERGELVMPGSTSTESGGNYMEHKGPNDMVRKGNEADTSELDTNQGVQVGQLGANDKILKSEMSGDAADKWLRENDPNYKNR